MKKISLNGKWTLVTEKFGELPATVPGCLHTDLIDNGIIKDIFYRDNNENYQWIENENVIYKTTFDSEYLNNVSLCFDGLDTYSEIFLNGEKIGESSNMFIPHEFNLDGKLKNKGNILEVKFRSPIKEVEGKPELEAAFTAERLHIRRIQCTFGWDWVDRFVTMGIFKNVYLKYANDMYCENVYIATSSLDKYSAGLYLDIEFGNYNLGSLVNVEILDPNGKFVEGTEFFSKEPHTVRYLDIKNPLLWWPNGYGEHPLYTVKVTVGNNVYTDTFGIRTAKILQLRDEENSKYYNKAMECHNNFVGKIFDRNDYFSGFGLLVNGEKILCLGGNWVPSEPFPSAETKEKFHNLITEAVSMNANFLRVWGGGIFEDDEFYYECDRNGIIVVQDFLLACGHYPEKEKWFIDELNKESYYAVKKLRNHPSLCWWHGDNENAQKGADIQPDHTGRDTALWGIAPNVTSLDRYREFIPSSPYGGNLNSSITRGTTHNSNYIYEIFEQFYNTDCTDYKEFLELFLARFISEEPTFGGIETSSLMRFMSKEDIADKEELIYNYHCKTNPFLPHTVFEYIKTFAEKLLGEFTDTEDKLFKYRYVQYEWVRVLFENCRKHLDYNNGLVFWMFNDCWPSSMGWSFVDYYLMPKASYYIFKRLAKNVTGAISLKNNKYVVSLSNKQNYNIDAKISGTVVNTVTGERKEIAEFALTATSYGVTEKELSVIPNKDEIIYIDVTANGETDRTFYKYGLINMEKTEEFTVTDITNNSFTVTALTDIHVFQAVGDNIYSDNYFTLLKGETKTVTFSKAPNGLNNELSFIAYKLK